MRFTILLFVLVLFSCQNNEVSPLKVPTEIEKLVFEYVQAWSERDVDYITENTYGAPFVLFLEDTTIFLNDFENIKTFLKNTFFQILSLPTIATLLLIIGRPSNCEEKLQY